MRILIVSQYFWPESFRINDLAVGLVQRGHGVTVLTGMPNYPQGRLYPGYSVWGPTREDYHGVDVVRVPLISRGQSKSIRLAMNYLSFAATSTLLGPGRCDGPFDMIFVYEPSPISVCLPAIRMKSITGAPLILWVQDLWPESLTAVKEVRSGAAMRLLERLVRWIYSRCDHVLVQSRAFTPQIAMRGVPPERISYLPNWAEEEYRPVDLEADAPHRKEMPDGFRVMFAGNIGAAQSFETIVAAADKLRTHKDIHWVILGDGRKKEWVQQEVERLGLSDHVHLLGRRPMETMPCYFSLADAMLVTLARQPIFAMTIPAKVQSYLACGRPIVAALDGEGGRIIQEAGAGLVCGSEDADGLARAVLELYQMPPDRRQAMAGRGLAYFQEHFQRDKLLDELERLMISMLER